MPEVYFGHNCPVGIGTNFITRAQTFEVNKALPSEERYELGNIVPVGLLQREAQYTGRLVFFPIDFALETRFAGLTPQATGNTVSWKDLLTSSGVTIHWAKGGLQTAVANALDYTCRVGGELSGTLTFDGTNWDDGASITASAPSGAPCFRAKEITISVGSTSVARAQGFAIRAGCRVERVYELGTENPIYVARIEPTVSIDIDWVESDNMAGNLETLTPAAPGNITVTATGYGDTLTFTLYNMAFVSKGQTANVGGAATRAYSYRSVGLDTDYYGLKLQSTLS